MNPILTAISCAETSAGQVIMLTFSDGRMLSFSLPIGMTKAKILSEMLTQIARFTDDNQNATN